MLSMRNLPVIFLEKFRKYIFFLVFGFISLISINDVNATNFNLDYSKYEEFGSTVNYFDKYDLIIDKFYNTYNSDEYGITIFTILEYKSTNKKVSEVRNDKSSTYILMYSNTGYYDIGYTIYGDGRVMNIVRALTVPNNTINLDHFSNTTFHTSTFEEFSNDFANGVYDDYFNLTSESSGSESFNPNWGTGLDKRDYFIYYSSKPIKVNSVSSGFSFSVNGTELLVGDSIPTYKEYVETTKKDYTWLDNEGYEKKCFSRPIAIGAKSSEYTGSNIYFDYDFTINNYDTAFQFYHFNRQTETKERYYGTLIGDSVSDDCLLTGSCVGSIGSSGSIHGGGGTTIEKNGFYELPFLVNNEEFTIIDSPALSLPEPFSDGQYCLFMPPGYIATEIAKFDDGLYGGDVFIGGKLENFDDHSNYFNYGSTDDVFTGLTNFLSDMGGIFDFIKDLFMTFWNSINFYVKSLIVFMFVISLICLFVSFWGWKS